MPEENREPGQTRSGGSPSARDPRASRKARPLIHIGYHKTGTSWLQGNLFRNAEAGFMWGGKRVDSPVNRLVATHPLDFSVRASRADFKQSLAGTAERGLLPAVSLERLSGHPFSGGYDSKEIACRLADVFPRGRVLVVIREQRSMILSTYKQYVKAGGALPLRHFLEPPVYRNVRARVPQFDFRHFEYHRLIALYRDLFSPQRVLVLPYERLAANPRGFVAAIARFAGTTLEPEVLESLPYDARPNLASPVVAVRAQRIVNRWFVRTDVNPAPLVASPRAAALLTRGVNTAHRAVAQRMSERIERRFRERVQGLVGDRYADSNRVSSEMAGIDLGAYGYDCGN
jgi:hypothetical protein